MRFHYEYGGLEGESFTLPDERFLGLFRPRDAATHDVDTLVRDALDMPVGAKPLRDAVRERRRVLILVDGGGSSMPVARILPHVERELRKGGIRDDDVTLLLARGTRRPLTPAELEAKIGPSFLARWAVRQHDWRDDAAAQFLGRTAGGMPVLVNRRLPESDLVLGLGNVAVSALLGYSGGADAVAPGAAAQATVAWLDWQAVDAGVGAVMGRVETPARQAVEEAARLARLHLVLNFVTDGAGNVHAAAYGGAVAAQRSLAAIAHGLEAVSVPGPASVVVADAGAGDQDFAQSLQGLLAASLMVNQGGSIVLVAPSTEGVAGSHPALLDLGRLDVPEIRAALGNGGAKDPVGGALAALIGQARRRARIHLVSSGVPAAAAQRMGFTWHGTVQEAVADALTENGDAATVSLVQGADRILPCVGGADAVDSPALEPTVAWPRRP